MKTLFTAIFSALLMFSYAGEFKVKFEIQTVDHSAIEVTSLVITEHGEEILRQKVPADGDVKLKLEEGKLYEAWIMKEGYTAHVIHNIHSEGDGKFKVTLYKTSESLPAITSSYLALNREFDNVKEMTIPAELLGDSIRVVKEGTMSKDEQKSLSKIQSIAKSQTKAQKKIDKLIKKRAKLDEDISELSAELATGETERAGGEEDKLKLQEKIVKIQGKLEKLAY